MAEQGATSVLSAEMALIDDEALVVLAKDCAYSPARDEILVRYQPQAERIINWLSRTTEFGSTDIEDARQNAVFWTVEAISKFDTLQSEAERRCSFHSFLHRVLSARFKDFSKHIRRVERRRTLTGDPLEQEIPPSSAPLPADPATIAENAEAARQLQAAVAGLDEECREMWRRLCAGEGLREVADAMGMSYDAAKRRRRKMISDMALRLRGEFREEPRSVKPS